jgi:Ran GTPase-activating protein (RanGAP) involved in mRNA processing and transport
MKFKYIGIFVLAVMFISWYSMDHADIFDSLQKGADRLKDKAGKVYDKAKKVSSAVGLTKEEKEEEEENEEDMEENEDEDEEEEARPTKRSASQRDAELKERTKHPRFGVTRHDLD